MRGLLLLETLAALSLANAIAWFAVAMGRPWPWLL